jgi:UDP-glucose 4-epimerase
VDVVFHLAASVFPARSLAEPCEDAMTNIIGTLQVLDGCRRAGAGRVVYASSAALYGEPRGVPVAEDSPPAPISPYGVSKLTAEQYCRLYARLYGLSAIALRYFTVYGSRQLPDSPYSGVISRFADRAQRGLPLVIYGDGSQTRDFINVDDVVRANLLAARSTCGGAYNIGSGRATSVAELAASISATVAELTGRPQVPVDRGPARLGDIRHSVAAPDLAAQVLGFHAQVTLEEGLHTLLRTLVAAA